MAKTSRIALGVMLFPGFAAGAGQCQQLPSPPPFERHVQQIRMIQTDEFIRASALCEQARQSKFGWGDHDRDVDPATLEPDLRTLMEKSDEVVLVGYPFDQITAISPSREDVVGFHDVKVLRTWKGSHKVGETLTFAIPAAASIKCGPGISGRKATSFTTITARRDWSKEPFINGLPSAQFMQFGAYVLFLRRSQGEERRFIPGFRLTGGDGMQGMFAIPFDVELRSKEEKNCHGLLPGAADTCRTYLEASPIPVWMSYARDPLFKQYNGMPIFAFINEVQSVADSLGYSQPAPASK